MGEAQTLQEDRKWRARAREGRPLEAQMNRLLLRGHRSRQGDQQQVDNKPPQQREGKLPPTQQPIRVSVENLIFQRETRYTAVEGQLRQVMQDDLLQL